MALFFTGMLIGVLIGLLVQIIYDLNTIRQHGGSW